MACSVKKHDNINQNMTDFNFEKAWEKVNSLEKQGLAQTVFKKVVEIHEEALKNNNGEQIIKSLIYQGKILSGCGGRWYDKKHRGLY